MDREECPVTIHSGDDSPTVCVCDSPPPEVLPAPADDTERAGAGEGILRPDEAGPENSVADNTLAAQVIEALLFSSDTPLSGSRLADLADLGSAKEVRFLIADLNAKYMAAKLSFRIEEIAHGYQMLTQPQYRPWLARLNKHQAQNRLSAAALETLSVVAYKQPVIRADLEAIRGVSCGEVLNRLREMGLVKIVGRAEIIGRPILYGTTRKFLDVFGLADLDDLPPMEMLTLRRSPVTAPPVAPVELPIAAAGA